MFQTLPSDGRWIWTDLALPRIQPIQAHGGPIGALGPVSSFLTAPVEWPDPWMSSGNVPTAGDVPTTVDVTGRGPLAANLLFPQPPRPPRSITEL